MSDSLLPPAPSLDEPLEILAACHGRIEQQLRTLEKLLEHLPQHGADTQARQAATAVMRYFDTAGRNHHADEEANLFPTLLERSPGDSPLAALIGELRAEHAHMETLWNELHLQLDAIAQGSAALSRNVVAEFSERYRRHIERENTGILPAAARRLTANDLQRLSRAMTARRRLT